MPFGNLTNTIHPNRSFPLQDDLDFFVERLLIDVTEVFLNPDPNLKTYVDKHRTRNLSKLQEESGYEGLLTFDWNELGRNRLNQGTNTSVSKTWQLDYQLWFTMLLGGNNKTSLHKQAYGKIIQALTNNLNSGQDYKTPVPSTLIYGSNLSLNEFDENSLRVLNEPENPAQYNYITATFNIIFKIYLD